MCLTRWVSGQSGACNCEYASEEELRAGLRDLRDLANEPNAGLGWVVHTSTAVL